MAILKIKIHPYEVNLTGTECNVQNIKEIFKDTNVTKNILAIDDTTTYAFIVEDKYRVADNEFVYGRYTKLRDWAPKIFNRATAKERDIELELNEAIEEVSHFVWNINDGLLFGEYNHTAARYFASLTTYFNKKFDRTDTTVLPIRSKDTKGRFLRQRAPIRKLRVRVAQTNQLAQEEEYALSPLLNFLDFANETSFEIIIRKARGKGEPPLHLPKVIEFAESLFKKKDNLQVLEVETIENAKYDLIHDNLLEYPIKLDLDTRDLALFNRSMLYEEIRKEYNYQAPQIKEMLRSTFNS